MLLFCCVVCNYSGGYGRCFTRPSEARTASVERTWVRPNKGKRQWRFLRPNELATVKPVIADAQWTLYPANRLGMEGYPGPSGDAGIHVAHDF